MAEIIEGRYSGEGLRFGIVVSRFNEFVTRNMLEGTLNELRRFGVSDTALKVVWVPGAYEIPFACQTLCQSKTLDGLVAIGCIIRGETSHYEHIAQSVCDGIQKVTLGENIPIGLGVIMVENMAQAIDRAGGKRGNKGREAAKSAIEMVQLLKELKSEPERETALKGLIEREFKK